MNRRTRAIINRILLGIVIIVILFFVIKGIVGLRRDKNPKSHPNQPAQTVTQTEPAPKYPPLDIAAYNKKLLAITNFKPAYTHKTPQPKPGSPAVVPIPFIGPMNAPGIDHKWPVRTAYPIGGAILPFSRIVAFYGNLYSKQMGILGQYPSDVMLAKLKSVESEWQTADPSTPVVPALDYVTVAAQGDAGSDGMYRSRMPDSQIQKIISMAHSANAIIILDVQVGKSTVQQEIPLLEKYLQMPDVHLAIDPEFSMKGGQKPGTVVGSFDATDINYVSNYLANLVTTYNLPPKILIVHRFTQNMVTNYQNIQTLPQVQFVMDMDGWGAPSGKISTYGNFIEPQPVQFTGFKLFYKNDLIKAPHVMLTPEQVLQLTPQPSFIQYQ